MQLGTVIITTYNSGNFIIETLESILKQSYPNIELIIGDDASTDDTMEKVRFWLEKDHNRNRFSNVRIVEVPENTGPSVNANRTLQIANGAWVKFLGADDTLLPHCISDNMKYVSENTKTRVLFSKINLYRDTFEEKNFLFTTPNEISPDSIIWDERSAESQYKMLLLSDRIHFTPSVFLHRETLLSVGGFDERFKFMEDYPLWLNLTRNGHKLYFMDKVTVNYRRHAKAINNTGIDYLVNPNYFRQENFRRLYTYPSLPLDIRYNQRYNWLACQVFRFNWLNRKNKINRFLFILLTIYLNPFKYYIWLKKRLSRNLRNNEFYIYC